jgi:hypothetical protein
MHERQPGERLNGDTGPEDSLLGDVRILTYCPISYT